MATTTDPLAGEPVPHAGAVEAERAARFAREDVRTGRVVADEDVDAWLDLLVSGEPLATPDIPSGYGAK
jgi:hypothetical protein